MLNCEQHRLSFYEYPIDGDQINSKNAKFLSKIKAGDTIIIDCVNIKKAGSTSLSAGIEINVIK